jgi:RND family efflux transporter MFP subunit
MTQAEAGKRDAVRVRAAKNRRRLLRNIAIAAAAVIVIAVVWRWRAAREGQGGLITAEVRRMDLTEKVSATGSVTAQTGAMVKIGSQITGRIKRLFADVGTQMKAGEVIAELDVPDLEAQVRQAEATLALNRSRLAEQLAGVSQQQTQVATDIEKARAGLKVAKANLVQVERSADLQRGTAEAQVRQAAANDANSSANLKRMEELFAKGYVAASEVDSARAQAEVNAAALASARENLRLVNTKLESDLESARQAVSQAEATLAAAEAGAAQNAIKQHQVAEAKEAVRQSEAALALSRAQLAKAFIRTPISGTVLQLTQQQGETIAAGLSAPTLIIVADLDRLQVDAFVDETDIGKVRLGQPAEVTVDAYPDEPFHGVVQKIASGATMQENVVTYDVTIALRNPEQRLKPDMTATVNITVASKKDALAVPMDAVTPEVDGSRVTVVRRGPGGEVRFEPAKVTTGINDGENVEVLEGLKEGDVVVLSGGPGGGSEFQGPRFSPFGGLRPRGRGVRGGR